MIGGFLGAGKTTAVARLARHLTDQGKRVGLICNDQSSGLVDTTLLRSQGFPVEEITGGCFCCRFNSLLEAAEALTRDSRPDLFLAEPVGSCTDLVATVSYPLRRIYGDRFTVAPLSVMVDPVRAARMVGLVGGRSFSEKVTYVYRKQLQEADVIVVNKCDAHAADLLDELSTALGGEFPQATVLTCSARTGAGVDAWFETVLAENPASRALEIDYDIYAEGEALLGWLNCTVQLRAESPFDGKPDAGRSGSEAARTARGGRGGDRPSQDDPRRARRVGHAVGGEPRRQRPRARSARVAARPRRRGRAGGESAGRDGPGAAGDGCLRETLAALDGVEARVEHLEQLRPGRPVPTHRMA